MTIKQIVLSLPTGRISYLRTVRMSYDRALTIFSPDGHLFQVEYAMEAVNKGNTAVGIRSSDTIVLAVEKKAVPKLQDPRPVKKICHLDEHLVLAFAGLSADARVLINKARTEAQSHRLTVEDAPTVEYMARYIAGVQQKYTQKGGVRPFGVCTLIIGFTDERPRLFLTEPSGIHSEWRATAIGKSSKTVREFLEKYHTSHQTSPGTVDDSFEQLGREETIKMAVKALLEVVQSGASSMEIAVMTKDNKLRTLEQAEIQSIIEEIEKEKVAEGDQASRKRTLTGGGAGPSTSTTTGITGSIA
jgi:20S proteasome subunit alpha 4